MDVGDDEPVAGAFGVGGRVVAAGQRFKVAAGRCCRAHCCATWTWAWTTLPGPAPEMGARGPRNT
eukprot:4506674-Alexandrium_andersonii.AAC.1